MRLGGHVAAAAAAARGFAAEGANAALQSADHACLTAAAA